MFISNLLVKKYFIIISKRKNNDKNNIKNMKNIPIIPWNELLSSVNDKYRIRKKTENPIKLNTEIFLFINSITFINLDYKTNSEWQLGNDKLF